jgi:signal transduction histidine kinase
VDESENLSVNEVGCRVARLEKVIAVSRMLNSTLEQSSLLDAIIEVAMELTDTARASIMLVDESSGELRFVAATGQHSAELEPFVVPMDGSIAGTVVRQNKPLLVQDAQKDSRWYQQVDQGTGFVTNDAAIAIRNARLVSELKEAYAQLNELDRLKSEFIAIAAHELRTPLSMILGYATFLKEDASGTAREQMNIVLQSAMRLRSLIDDMVNLRQVDTGEASLELEQFCIQDLVQSCVTEIRSLAEAKGLLMGVSLPAEPITVEADRSKMTIVLANLISNAIKFTPNGGRTGIRGGKEDDHAWFAVWDTGIGIAQEHFERIFDRFYQIEPSLSRHYDGIGLGLAIVKEMVDLHHGSVKVQSEKGKGSAFTVTIPLRQQR